MIRMDAVMKLLTTVLLTVATAFAESEHTPPASLRKRRRRCRSDVADRGIRTVDGFRYFTGQRPELQLAGGRYGA